jgi:hypothetical protein
VRFILGRPSGVRVNEAARITKGTAACVAPVVRAQHVALVAATTAAACEALGFARVEVAGWHGQDVLGVDRIAELHDLPTPQNARRDSTGARDAVAGSCERVGLGARDVVLVRAGKDGHGR